MKLKFKVQPYQATVFFKFCIKNDIPYHKIIADKIAEESMQFNHYGEFIDYVVGVMFLYKNKINGVGLLGFV